MRSIENQIVKLQFSNEQFERNVAATLKTLDKLNGAIESIGTGPDGFTKIQESVNKVDFSKIQNGIEFLTQRFSTAGLAFQQIIQSLTSDALQLGKTLVNSVLGPIKTGGWNRASNIDKAKFQLKGLGVAWEEIQEDINYGVSDTAYGLDAAAVAASQLVASGIEFGKTFGETGNSPMAKALRGISGVAAMTNSSYEEIAHIFTTVAGQGRVMTEQLRMLESRGLNAASKLGEAMGKTETEIREMVTDGQINFKMFSEAMDEAFGEHSKEANSTLEGSLANMKAALARIGADFAAPIRENMIPVFNELRLKFKEVKGQLGELGKSGVYEQFAQTFRALTTTLTGFIHNIDVSFLSGIFETITKALKAIVDYIPTFTSFISRVTAPIGKAFDLVQRSMEPITRSFKHISKGINEVQDTTEKITKTAKSMDLDRIEEIALEIIEGKWGQGQERFDKLTKAFGEFEKFQNEVNKLLSDPAHYEDVAKRANETKDAIDETVDAEKALAETEVNPSSTVDKDASKDIADGFTSAANAVIDANGNIIASNKKTAKSTDKSTEATKEGTKELSYFEIQAKQISYSLLKLKNSVTEFFKTFKIYRFSDEEKKDIFDKLNKSAGSFLKVGKFVLDMFSSIVDGAKGPMVFLMREAAFFGANVVETVGEVVEVILKFLQDIGALDKIKETVNSVLTSLKDMFKFFNENHDETKNNIVNGLSDFLSWVTRAITKVKEFWTVFSQSEGFNRLKKKLKDTKDDILNLTGGALKNLQTAIGGIFSEKKNDVIEFTDSTKNVFDFTQFIIDSANSIADAIDTIHEAILGFLGVEKMEDGTLYYTKHIGDTFEKVSLESQSIIGVLVERLPSFFLEKATDMRDAILKFFGLEIIQGQMYKVVQDGENTSYELIQGFTDIGSVLSSVVENITAFFNSVQENGFLDTIKEYLGTALTTVKDFIIGLLPSSVEEAIMSLKTDGIIKTALLVIWKIVKGIATTLLGGSASIIGELAKAVFGDTSEAKKELQETLGMDTNKGLLGSVITIFTDGNKLFKKALKNFGFVTAIYNGIIKPLKGFGDLLMSGGTLAKNISNFGGISRVLNGMGRSSDADALLKVAEAIGVLALALIGIAQIPTDQMWNALAVVTTLGTLVTLISVVLNKAGGGGTSGNFGMTVRQMLMPFTQLATSLKSFLSKVGDATFIVLVATSISTLADSFEKLGNLNTDQISNGVIALGAVIGELELALWGAKKINGEGKTSLSLAVMIGSLAKAIDMLSDVFIKLSKLNTDEISNGIVSLGAVIAELEAALFATNYIDNVFEGGSGLTTKLDIVAISFALDKVSDVFLKLKDVNVDEMNNATVALGAVILELEGALFATKYIGKVFNGKGGAGLSTDLDIVVISYALDTVSDVFIKLSSLNPDQVSNAVASLGAVILELEAALFATKYIGKVSGGKGGAGLSTDLDIIVLSSAIDKVGEIFIKLGQLTSDQAHTAIQSLGAIILELEGALLGLNTINAAFDTGGGIKDKVSRLVDDLGLVIISEAVNQIKDTYTALGELDYTGTTNALRSLQGIFKELKSTTLVIDASNYLFKSNFKSKLAELIEIIVILGSVALEIKAVASMDQEKVTSASTAVAKIVNSVGNIVAALALLNFSKNGLLGSVSNILPGVGIGGELIKTAKDVAVFALGALLVTGAIWIMEKIEGEEGRITNFCNKAVPILEAIGTAIGSFIGSILKTGLLEPIAESFGLTELGKNIEGLVDAVKPMFGGEDGFNPDPSFMTNIKEIFKQLAEATFWQLVSKVFTALSGENSLAALSGELIEFGNNIETFIASTENISDETVTKVHNLFNYIKEMADGSKMGGLNEIWAGKIDIDKFGEMLLTMCEKMGDYIEAVSPLKLKTATEKTQKIKEIVDLYSDFISNDGMSINGAVDTQIGYMVTQLQGLAEILEEDITGNATSIEKLTSIGENIFKNVLAGFSASVYNEEMFQASASSVVTNFANSILTSENNAKIIDAVKNMFSEAFGAAAQALDEESDETKDNGVMVSLTNLYSKIVFITKENKKKIKAEVEKMSDYLKEPLQKLVDQFKETGMYSSLGMAEGILENSDYVRDAAAALAQKAINAANDTLGIHSPARELIRTGYYTDLGFAVGLEKYQNQPVSAARSVASMVLTSFTDTLEKGSKFSRISKSIKNTAKYANAVINDEISSSPVITPVFDMRNLDAARKAMSGIDFRATTSLSNAVVGAKNNAKMVSSYDDTGILRAINEMNQNIDVLGNRIANMKMMMDSGAVVGEITERMDASLGNKQKYEMRWA